MWNRPEVRLYARDADLAEDGGQACEHRRAECVPQPRGALRLAGALLFLNHQERARGDEYHADPLRQADALAQEDRREQDREHGAGLVDRDDLVHVAELERPEIAQPARARGESRQHQKQQRPPADGRDRPL